MDVWQNTRTNMILHEMAVQIRVTRVTLYSHFNYSCPTVYTSHFPLWPRFRTRAKPIIVVVVHILSKRSLPIFLRGCFYNFPLTGSHFYTYPTWYAHLAGSHFACWFTTNALLRESTFTMVLVLGTLAFFFQFLSKRSCWYLRTLVPTARP